MNNLSTERIILKSIFTLEIEDVDLSVYDTYAEIKLSSARDANNLKSILENHFSGIEVYTTDEKYFYIEIAA